MQMTASVRMKCFLFVVALIFTMQFYVSAEEIQACADENRSVGKSPEKLSCMGQGQADFTVASPAATGASNGLEFESETGTFMVNLDTDLTLTSVAQCPVELELDVTCDHFRFTVGSGPGEDDGTPIKVADMAADGLVEWECRDASSDQIELRYYFLAKFADDGTDLGSPATDDLSTAKGAGGASSSATNLDPTVFQKFDQVDANTEIFYLKTPDLHHFVFKSKQTTITLLSANYLAAVTAAQAAVNPEPVCNNAVRVCFTENCEKGKNGSGSQTVMPFSFLVLMILSFSSKMF